MPKKLIEIASEIVQTQVSRTSMTATDITSSLWQVFGALHELQRAESGEIELPKIEGLKEEKPPLTPEDSIQNDKVICLECGAEFKLLTHRHLVAHGMSQKEYKKKYGFSMRIPLAAKSVTKARSKAAKKRGLPEKLKKYMETRRQAKDEVSKPSAIEPVTASKPKDVEAIQERSQKRKPALTPENSIQNDKVICLECGAEMKQITQKHLVFHGMDQKEYKKKYGFKMGTPLAAKSLIEARQKTAKTSGLSERMKQFWEAKRQQKVESAQAAPENVIASKPKRTRLRKKTA